MIARRVVLAGEYTATDYPATVHGAYNSGLRAGRLLHSHSTGPGRVAVVGAGMAGLGAAEYLSNAGWQVEILEARDRVGGRIHTDTSLGAPVELGASWVHGVTGNPMVRLVKEAGLSLAPTNWSDARARAYGTGRPAPGVAAAEAELWRIVEGLENRRSSPALSLADAMAADGWRATTPAARLAETAELVMDYGLDLDRLGAQAVWEGRDAHGGDSMVVGGFAAVPQLLASGLDVRLGVPVRRVAASATEVRLDTDDGPVTVDAAVVAVPLAMLQSGLPVVALPPVVADAVAGLVTGNLEKVFLRYAEVWWPDASVLQVMSAPEAAVVGVVSDDRTDPVAHRGGTQRGERRAGPTGRGPGRGRRGGLRVPRGLRVNAPPAATGIGSMPGTSVAEAMAVIAGEVPDLPFLPELPARGAGADMVGRTAALLLAAGSDFALEPVPTGWRRSGRVGPDMRRATSWLGEDLDRLEQVLEGFTGRVKVQMCGPWTWAAAVEDGAGRRSVRDEGFLSDLADAMALAAVEYVAGIRRRLPAADVLLQIDEPGLPAVLAGDIPTASGLGRLAAVAPARAASVLGRVVAAQSAPVLMHCCAAFPFAVAREAGVAAVSWDTATPTDPDEVALTFESGISLFAGAVSATQPGEGIDEAWHRFTDMWGRTGLGPAAARSVSITPGCGLAGAGPDTAREALARSRRLLERVTLEAE